MKKLVAWPIVVAGLIAGCSSGTGVVAPSTAPEATSTSPAPSSAPAAEPTSSEAPAESAAATPEATPEATQSAEAGPTTFTAGELVTVTKEGADWAHVRIDKVRVVKQYKDTYYTDKPQTKGDVFIEAQVTYEALVDGVDYNPFDWQVFAAGTAIKDSTILLNGPKPTLSSGSLPKGRKAVGYVVYEVPATGEVRMSYTGNIFLDAAPIFEVVIRAK